jgi:hypothetical protein
VDKKRPHHAVSQQASAFAIPLGGSFDSTHKPIEKNTPQAVYCQEMSPKMGISSGKGQKMAHFGHVSK